MSKFFRKSVFWGLVILLLFSLSLVAFAQEEMSELEKKTADEAFAKADKGQPDPDWKGKKFTIAVLASGPHGAISGPLYFWRPYWEELTGATYDIAEIPFGELQAKIFTDFATGTGNYDCIVGPSFFYGDYIANDWIIPIDKYFDDPRMPEWDRESIAPPIRELLQWGDNWYGFNNDHDGMVIYYRKDLFNDPRWQAEFKEEYGYDFPVSPVTWQEILDIAKFFNGKDWNGDGKDDFGITMHLKVGEQGFFNYIALAGSFVCMPAPGDDPAKITRYHNVFWFDPETMEPLINTPGHVKALEMLTELTKAGPSAMVGWGLGEAWDVFLRGNAAMCFTFGDVGTLSQDPRVSVVQGKLGVAPIPGSKEVYDLENEQWITLEEPNLVGNKCGASWHGVISSYAEDPDMIAHFLSWQATPEINHWNVAWGWTGIDPGTTYDFLEPAGKAKIEDYTITGYDAEDITQFLDAYYTLWFEYPRSVPYLRIAGAADYIESLDIHMSEALTGQATPQEAWNRAAQDWNRITDQLGREEQKELYKEAIGYSGE
ncbi:MAG TPA: extracellular solute-binding protein [Candidatus Atribacteria bacterium]|jgi:multiple sugar transport system substrate-binding protein|nr:extracellular solute-binding protein [Atribacterota bacterium]HOQ50504.1 extracellular solute-binding protein [Candidatus Atribacteria bacterium]HPT63334.1 extracellular solute-binding protein [Candidatus Atribacteria bacterium]HPZ39360.1 extracellular solute-binding protein [Candidatus Atribacteria bacterium]HQD32765.1 extracellular solute-binding protein [Candidatus Atribacteria bacterium]